MEEIIKDLCEAAESICANKLNSIYYTLGQHHEQLHYALKAYQLIANDANEEVAILKCLSNLAGAYLALSDYQNAFKNYEEARVRTEKKCGKKHVNYATIIHNIADVYRSSGNLAQTKQHLNDAYQLFKAQGSKSIGFIRNINQLGITYFHLGNNEEAERKYNEGISLVEEHYGIEHPIVLEIYDDLARLYTQQGKYGQAENILKRAYCVYERIFGNIENRYKSSLLVSEGELAHELCFYDNAIAKYEDALKVTKKEYGENSLSSVHIRSKLASVYQSVGKYKIAIEKHHESLIIYENKQITRHYNIAGIHKHLCSIYVDMSNGKAADDEYHKATQQFTAVLGNDFNQHPEKANLLNLKGNLKKLTHKKDDQIRKYYQSALQIYEAIYGKEAKHPDIAKCYNNLGSISESLEDNEQAIKYFSEALVIYDACYGKKHYEYACTLNNIGCLWEKLNNPNLAINGYAASYKILKKLYKSYNSNHPRLITVLNHLGSGYFFCAKFQHLKQQYDQAIESLRKANYYWGLAYVKLQQDNVTDQAKLLDNIQSHLKSCKNTLTEIKKIRAIVNKNHPSSFFSSPANNTSQQFTTHNRSQNNSSMSDTQYTTSNKP